MLGTSQEMLKTMGRILARLVPQLMSSMHIQVSRSSIEQSLHQLLSSMQFATPIPAIKVYISHSG